MESVNIATLKAKLSHYLRAVRRGETVDILDHNTPVAKLVPCEEISNALPSRLPSRRLEDVALPSKTRRGVDSTAVLLEDRAFDR